VRAPTATVVVFPGSNCEEETAAALLAAGFETERVWHEEVRPGRDLYVLPGGFSYGDYLRPGAVAARSPALPVVRAAWQRGAHVLGICNGFQILQEAGLLPGALVSNIPAGFLSRPVRLAPRPAGGAFGVAVGTRPFTWPIAHSTGRLHLTEAERVALWRAGRVLAAYRGDDPNGSLDHIAAIVDESGRVAGLMPHPERAADARLGSSDGARFFARLRREVARLAG
jgi:phosphoribosylformylglycinamidine synthase I